MVLLINMLNKYLVYLPFTIVDLVLQNEYAIASIDNIEEVRNKTRLYSV